MTRLLLAALAAWSAVPVAAQTLQPTDHDFQQAVVSSRTAVRYFTLWNNTTANITVGQAAISITGMATCTALSCPVLDAGSFAITADPCSNRTFAPETGCDILVVFSPTSYGRKTARLTVPGVNLSVNLLGTGILPADRVFNWGEATYTTLFQPAGNMSAEAGGYYYRYYPNTAAYLASKGGRIYYLGPASKNVIVDVGSEADLLSTATTAGY